MLVVLVFDKKMQARAKLGQNFSAVGAAAVQPSAAAIEHVQPAFEIAEEHGHGFDPLFVSQVLNTIFLHRVGGLEVRLGDRVLKPGLLAATHERPRVDVDHGQRLGVVDDQIAAAGQVDASREHAFDRVDVGAAPRAPEGRHLADADALRRVPPVAGRCQLRSPLLAHRVLAGISAGALRTGARHRAHRRQPADRTGGSGTRAVRPGARLRTVAARMPDALDIRVDNLSYPLGAGMSHETILFDATWTEGSRTTRRCRRLRRRTPSRPRARPAGPRTGRHRRSSTRHPHERPSPLRARARWGCRTARAIGHRSLRRAARRTARGKSAAPWGLL